jgi:hypothetical protein
MPDDRVLTRQTVLLNARGLVSSIDLLEQLHGILVETQSPFLLSCATMADCAFKARCQARCEGESSNFSRQKACQLLE